MLSINMVELKEIQRYGYHGKVNLDLVDSHVII